MEFRQANAMMERGAADEASAAYLRLAAAGWSAGPLYYNLGNAFVQLSQYGKARWAYMAAARRMPRDGQVAANLGWVTAKLSQAEEASVRRPAWLAAAVLQPALTTTELAALWLAVALGVLLAWQAAAWTRRPGMHSLARAMLLLAVWLGAALFVRAAWLDDEAESVVVRQTAVKFSPSDHAAEQFVLPEGAVVRLLHEQGVWSQVVRADGATGWVSRDAVWPVRRPPLAEPAHEVQ